ncbi:hypothetical protein Tco_1467882 [Tanacetum coccineum]
MGMDPMEKCWKKVVINFNLQNVGSKIPTSGQIADVAGRLSTMLRFPDMAIENSLSGGGDAAATVSSWHKSGSGLKKNSINDFISCGDTNLINGVYGSEKASLQQLVIGVANRS